MICQPPPTKQYPSLFGCGDRPSKEYGQQWNAMSRSTTFPRPFGTKKKIKCHVPDSPEQPVAQHLLRDCCYASLDRPEHRHCDQNSMQRAEQPLGIPNRTPLYFTTYLLRPSSTYRSCGFAWFLRLRMTGPVKCAAPSKDYRCTRERMQRQQGAKGLLSALSRFTISCSAQRKLSRFRPALGADCGERGKKSRLC